MAPKAPRKIEINETPPVKEKRKRERKMPRKKSKVIFRRSRKKPPLKMNNGKRQCR